MILHTVNQSPSQNQTLQSCLRLMQPESTLLLIENGVYGALLESTASAEVLAALDKVSIYALEPDLKARGLLNKLLPGIQLADYDTFVDLVEGHSTVQNWI